MSKYCFNCIHYETEEIEFPCCECLLDEEDKKHYVKEEEGSLEWEDV